MSASICSRINELQDTQPNDTGEGIERLVGLLSAQNELHDHGFMTTRELKYKTMELLADELFDLAGVDREQKGTSLQLTRGGAAGN